MCSCLLRPACSGDTTKPCTGAVAVYIMQACTSCMHEQCIRLLCCCVYRYGIAVYMIVRHIVQRRLLSLWAHTLTCTTLLGHKTCTSSELYVKMLQWYLIAVVAGSSGRMRTSRCYTHYNRSPTNLRPAQCNCQCVTASSCCIVARSVLAWCCVLRTCVYVNTYTQ
jgi:hypothetical protein